MMHRGARATSPIADATNGSGDSAMSDHHTHAGRPRRTHRARRAGGRHRASRWLASSVLSAAAGVALLAGCGSGGATASDRTTTPATGVSMTQPGGDGHADHGDHGATMKTADRAAAQLATAGFQDVAVAEANGYASSLETLGCFQDASRGGMGVHYIDQSSMDAHVDVAHPEALVYELDATGHITGLVAHEYIVPIEAWTASKPPQLFGVEFHRHPTLPLWVLHTWLWKDNPTGVFQDWNPAVRQCPAGVPVFGVDLPKAAGTPSATSVG